MVKTQCNMNIFIANGICDHGFESYEMVCMVNELMFQFSSLKAVIR